VRGRENRRGRPWARMRREIGEAVNGAPCICHLPAPPPSIASPGVYLFSHNNAPFRHNYRHYSGAKRERVLTRKPRAQWPNISVHHRCIFAHIHTHTHTHARICTHIHMHTCKCDPGVVAAAARNRPSILSSIARFIVF